MTALVDYLTANPLFALFATIALGYAVGMISVRGLSLGAGAVLFVGLAMGALAPQSALPGVVGTFGLLLFLYGVGVSFGAQFFKGLTSPLGIKANIASVIGVLLSLGLMLLAIKFVPGVSFAEAIGAWAGAGTSTSALQAAMVVTGDKMPATGYSVAYPFGVAVPILVIGLYNSFFKPKYTLEERTSLRVCAVRVENPEIFGKTMSDVNSTLPDGVSITTTNRGGKAVALGHLGELQHGDIVLITAVDNAKLDQAEKEYQRLFISNPNLAGKTIPQIRQLMTLNVSILHIRRGDTDMPLTQSLRMEIGDQIGVLAEVGHTKELQRFFGDSVKAGGEVNYLSMGVGAALGLAVGSIPFTIPGLGKVKLGLAGLLLVALYLGKARNTWKFTWSMPIAASRVFREFGLALFLAQVGMASGSTFVETVAKSGMTYLLLGVALVALLSISVLLITVYVFRIPYDMAAGIISGATGNPAILAFSSKTLASDKPDVGYAMIFPSMTVFKILLVQIIGAFM